MQKSNTKYIKFCPQQTGTHDIGKANKQMLYMHKNPVSLFLVKLKIIIAINENEHFKPSGISFTLMLTICNMSSFFGMTIRVKAESLLQNIIVPLVI